MSKSKQEWMVEKREAYYAFAKFGDILEKEGRALTSDEEALYKEAKDRLEQIQRQIDLLDEMDATRAAMNEPIKNRKDEVIGNAFEEAEKRNAVVNKWLRQGASKLTKEEQRLINLMPDDKGSKIEVRATAGVTNPTYVQSTDVMGSIMEAKRWYGGWFDAATELRTGKGNQINYPTTDDTGNTGSIETAGTDAFDGATAVTLGYKQLNSYFYSSEGLAIDDDDLADADFDLSIAIGKVLGTRLWRSIATVLMTGDGSSKPQGLARAAAKGLLTGNCTITFDRVIQFLKTMDWAHLQSPGSGFMFHQSMLFDIMGLKSTTGQPLWQPSMALGQPSTFMGYPYWVSNELTAVSTVSANSRHMLLGDFKTFVIRYAGPTYLIRLDERYKEKLQTGFIAIQRVDSELMSPNATTYASVKYLRRLGT